MTQKITIQELVSKYTFEVDESGAKAYEQRLKDGEKVAQKAATGETAARRKAAADIQKIQSKSSARVERATKRAERAKARSTKREVSAVRRATTQITQSRAAADAAAARGDRRGSRRAIRETRRAERAKKAAIERGAKDRERIERRITRVTAREARKAARIIKRESRAASRAVLKIRGAAARAGGGLDRLAGKLRGALTSFGPALAAAGGAAVLAGIGEAIGFVGDETARLDKIAKGAQQTGLGTELYQKLDQVATLSGTSIDVLAKGVIKLNRNLGDVAQGRGPKVADNLERLGLTLKDLEGVDPAEQIQVVAKALGSKNLSDIDKTTISIELFGKAGADLVPLLNSGDEAIRKMTDSVGKVFNREELARAEAYQDALANLNKAISFVKGSFAIGLAPTLQSVTELAERAIPVLQQLFEGLFNKLAPAFTRLVEAVKPWAERLAPETEDGLRKITGVLGFFVDALVLSADTISFFLELGNTLLTWIGKVSDMLENRWPRAWGIAAGAVNALLSPLETARSVASEVFDFVEKIVGGVGDLADKVKSIRGALGLSKGTGGGTGVASAAVGAGGEVQSKAAKDQAQAETRQKSRDQERERRSAERQSQRDDTNRTEALRLKRLAAANKKGKGKARKASGLEAQIDQQIKQLADQAELRASAQALQEGVSSKDAFAAGRDAAKETEQRLRSQFDKTGDLPVGIARNIEQLASSPAVEEGIGRVPPPVISVRNDVTNVTFENNEFIAQVEAAISGIGPDELGARLRDSFRTLLGGEITTAIQNSKPAIRV